MTLSYSFYFFVKKGDHMVGFAKPVFEAGPSDAVKEVDVYNITDTSIRNQLTSKLTSFGEGVSDLFGKSTDAIKGLGDKLKKGDINLETAKNRIQGALKGSKSDINSLATSAQNAIFGDITGKDSGTNYVRQANDLINTVTVVTTKGKQVFSGTGVNQVSSIMRFASDLTGLSVFKTLDLGAEAALVKGVLTEVSKWGIPSLVDDIIQNVDKDVAYSAVKRSSTNIASTSDIDTIQAYINNLGASVLTAEVPNFAQQTISRYRFKTGVTADQYPTLLAQLVSVMDALQPNWFFTTRNYIDLAGNTVSETVANLAVVTVASDDATTLLSTDERYLKYVISAPKYPAKSSRTLLKSMYPYIAIA